MTSRTVFLKQVTRGMKRGTNGGSWGIYVRISKKRGVKILRDDDEYRSPIDVIRSDHWNRAKLEMRNLETAKTRFPYIPKCYGIKIVKVGNSYHVGIVMQHLGEVALSDLEKYNSNLKLERIRDDCRSQLKRVGIIHTDLHYKNIMFFKNKFWVIDFDPEFIAFSDPCST